jgi:hypothetical protein
MKQQTQTQQQTQTVMQQRIREAHALVLALLAELRKGMVKQ